MRLYHSFTVLFPFSVHFLTTKQLLRQGGLPLPWLESWSIKFPLQVSSSSAVSLHAKWQQQPCHQWCANHLHNRIDGQDDLKGCLQISRKYLFLLVSWVSWVSQSPQPEDHRCGWSTWGRWHPHDGKSFEHLPHEHPINSSTPQVAAVAAYEDASNGR